MPGYAIQQRLKREMNSRLRFFFRDMLLAIGGGKSSFFNVKEYPKYALFRP